MTAIILSVGTFFSTALGGLFALYRRHPLYLVTTIGVLVAIAVISHDFGDGVSTVTIRNLLVPYAVAHLEPGNADMDRRHVPRAYGP